MNRKLFNLFHLLAALLVVSWLLPLTRNLWDRLDESTFFFLNGSLIDNPHSQAFWAVANHRIVDILSAFCMAGLFLFYVLKGPKNTLNQRVYEFIISSVVIVSSALFIKMVIGPLISDMGINRLSPSLELKPVVRISDTVDWISVKETSRHSFPGDHAAVLFIWAGLLAFVGGWRYLLIVVPYCILFSLPRLVSGAHWLTDDLVGSLSIALIILSWAFLLLSRFKKPVEDF